MDLYPIAFDDRVRNLWVKVIVNLEGAAESQAPFEEGQRSPHVCHMECGAHLPEHSSILAESEPHLWSLCLSKIELSRPTYVLPFSGRDAAQSTSRWLYRSARAAALSDCAPLAQGRSPSAPWIAHSATLA